MTDTAARFTGRLVFRTLGIASRVTKGRASDAGPAADPPSTWSPVPPDTDPYETY